ncbi:reverse transcriptase domain-containing protein [Tanacetum coccineum]
MPFGLRNVAATYQRLVDKAFHKKIGRNLEVYVDDLVIKSRTKDEIVKDIEETFKTLREINMKFNPKKCAFGVKEGMFLGYKVNTKGLKVCPDKKSDFHWTTEVEEAFKQMKQLIAELPMLTAPMEKEELIIYLAAAKETVSAVLTTEREAKQMPIYFVTRALKGEGLILTNPEGMEFTYALRFRFDSTNNEAEYEALIAGLRIAEQMGVKNLQANVDSRLVANQVNRTYVAKEVDMIRYLEKVRTLASSFKAFLIRQVPRSENKKADALSKIASTSFAHLSKQVLVEELKEKSIGEVEVLVVVEEEGDTWMTPIFEYLTEETLPVDVKKARADNPFKDWCEKLCIRQHFAFVKHPQTNGLVERANRSLGEGIKARLDARSKNWMEELSHVLWAHRTMIKSSNGDTPFSLTYGMEAVIPAEIGMPILRIAEVDLVQNNEALEINLDLLEEKREQAAIREVNFQKVRSTSFKPGDLVYRNNDASRTEDTGKLGPKWEGPYKVTKALGKGAYKLRDRDGKQLPCTWNVSNLKKCYVHKM